MNKSTFIITLFIASVLCSAETPIERHGELRVQGNQIVNAKGIATQLSGPALYWSIWGGEKYYTKEVVDWVATDWKASLIRATIGIEPTGGYLDEPSKHLAYARTVIDAAINNGIYVIVDFHAHDANMEVEQAKAFFDSLGSEYGDIPNIIWEIWNEPNDQNGSGSGGADTWSDDIKPYALQILPVIRKYSNNIVVVGTPSWSGNPYAAVDDAIDEPNVAYALHFYAATHKQTVRNQAEQARLKLPLFITEFGMCTADGGNSSTVIDTTETKKWLEWADTNKISWANWSLSAMPEAASALKSTASSLGGWSSNDLTVSGNWIRNRVITTNDTNRVVSTRDYSSHHQISFHNGLITVASSTRVQLNAIDLNGKSLLEWNGTLPAGTHKASSYLPTAGNGAILLISTPNERFIAGIIP